MVSIGSTLAGISVHETKINTTARNVANVNAQGFKKDRVTIYSNNSGQPEAYISKVDAPGYVIQGADGKIETSNVDLAEEMVSMITGKNGYMANLKVLEREQEIFDSVLEILA